MEWELDNVIECNWRNVSNDNNINNKKVLLRERKRHTARCVVSTPSVVLPGYPPRGGTRTPPGGVPGQVPPRGGTRSGTPPGGYPDPPAAPWHSGKCCKALWDMGTPPCGQTDGWMEGQTLVKTLPSLVLRTRAVTRYQQIEFNTEKITHSHSKQIDTITQFSLGGQDMYVDLPRGNVSSLGMLL